jgi:hypothetical protein
MTLVFFKKFNTCQNLERNVLSMAILSLCVRACDGPFWVANLTHLLKFSAVFRTRSSTSAFTTGLQRHCAGPVRWGAVSLTPILQCEGPPPLPATCHCLFNIIAVILSISCGRFLHSPHEHGACWGNIRCRISLLLIGQAEPQFPPNIICISLLY